MGVALLTTAIVLVGPTTLAHGRVSPHFLAYRVAFLVAAAFSLSAIVGSLAMNDAEAAPTMQLRRRAAARSGRRRVSSAPARAD